MSPDVSEGLSRKVIWSSVTRIRGHSSQVLIMQQMLKMSCTAYLLYLDNKIVSEGGLVHLRHGLRSLNWVVDLAVSGGGRKRVRIATASTAAEVG